MRERKARALVIAFSLPAVFLASCGSVGEPLPPLLNIPGPVVELRASQIADEIILTWRAPEATTEGRPLKPLRGYEIRAMTLAAGTPAPSNETFDQMSRDIALLNPAPDPRAPLTATLDAAPFLGERTAFRVQAVGESGRVSPPAPFVVIEAVEPPPAPAGLRAEATAEGVRLAWSAVRGASRYRVVRREIGPEAAVEPSISESGESEILDRSIVWGKHYEYFVLTLVAAPTGPVPGPASAAVEITPADRFAPPPPRDLRAVAAGDSVELSWSGLEVSDLAGYRVLRDGQAIHEGVLADPAFSDRNVVAGAVYRYAVEAEDLRGNRSEPSETVEATIR